MKKEVKPIKKNPYYDQYSFADIKIIDDHKYIMRGSEKQFIHLCTVFFAGQHYCMFCQSDRLVEILNRQRLGDDNFGFLKETALLKPSLYIEKVKFMPKSGMDTIGQYLEFIADEDLFQFLLEFFHYSGIIKDFEIKGRS